MKNTFSLLLSLLFVLGSLHAEYFPDLPTQSAQGQHLAAINLHVQHPYVALQPGNLMLAADPENAIQIQDLRGVECYGQPDRLGVCAPGDTIPILLFTKSETPINDIILTVNFDDGLEYGGFAIVNSGPAVIDVVNEDNLEAPVFRINELSQVGGAISVYIGVRASCGLNLDVSNPAITFQLDYTAGSQECSDALTPEVPYGSNVVVPEVVFNGTPTRRTLDITDRDADACTTFPISQVTQGTGALGAILTIDDYGFDVGNEVSSVSVDGTPVPAADIDIDLTTGALTVVLDGETNTGYFGGDGLLAFGENASLEICFQGQNCFNEVTPDLTIIFACERELCIGAPDPEVLTLRNRFNFDVAWNITNVVVEQSPSACGASGRPDPFLVSYDIASASGDFRGDLLNTSFFINECVRLIPDTVYYTVNGGGDFYPLPTQGFIQNGNAMSPTFGRTIIDLNATGTAALISTDPDLPGIGIEDLDGDGKFDDIAGDQTLKIFLGLSPNASGSPLSCGGAGGICNFTEVGLNGRNDCGSGVVASTAPIPGTNSLVFNSTAGIGGDTTTYISGSTRITGGFNFGVVGITRDNPTPPNLSESRNVTFNYDLDPAESFVCGTVNSRIVRVQFVSILGSVGANIELTSPAATTGTATLVADQISTNNTIRTWDLEVDPLTDINDVSFTLTIDTNVCVNNTSNDLSIFLLDFCDGCNTAPTTRACDAVPLDVDPDNFPNCRCDYETFVELDRVSRGFTNRSQNMQVSAPQDRGIVMGPISNFVDIDTLQVLPGDTVGITSKIVVGNESSFSNLAFILFQLNQVGSRNTFNHFLDSRNAFLTEFTFQRPGMPEIDLGAVNPGPAVGGNYQIGSGGGQEATTGSVVPQPGISHTNFQVRRGGGLNNRDVTQDGNGFRLLIQDATDGSSTAYSDILAAIGGNWLAGDTITVRWEIPVVPIPDRVFPGGSNPPEDISGQQIMDVSRFDMGIEGRLFNGAGGFTGNVIGGSSACVRRPAMQFYEPRPKVDASIDYQASPDGCAASITVDYTIENPPPAGFYPNEYRPVIGLENFDLTIPASYFTNEMTYQIEVLNGGPTANSFFTSGTLDTIAAGAATFLVADPVSGTLSFADSEFIDGTNWPDYLAINGPEIDITTVGADLPLLGVGLGENDTLRLTIPLDRICPIDPATGLSVTGSLANTYLMDYNTRVYECNNERWSTAPCAGAVRYFPFNRTSAEHPGRFAFDETYTIINPPLPIMPASGTVASMLVTDVDGVSETNNYTLTSPDAVPAGGMLSIEVANAVDLISISGDATVFTEVATTDSSTVYRVDIPALAAGGTFSIDLETDLLFCGTAFVNISPVLGCNSDDLAVAAILSGADCGGRRSYAYISGLADIRTTFVYSGQQNGCMPQTYSVQFRNTGGSDLTAFQPTVYVPEGLMISSGQWMVQTFSPGAGPTTIADPTENTGRTGVYGRAFQWPDGFFAGVPGTDIFEIGEIIVVSFVAEPTCDFTSGLPIVAETNTAAACDREFMTEPAIGPPINIVMVPDPTAPSFEFSVTENRISCDEGAAPITLTAVNTGKAPASMTELCFVLPPGVVLAPENITAIAPVGFTPMVSAPTPVGTGGATEICLDGPEEGIGAGEFICLDILPVADNVECGPLDIGFRLKRTTNIDCAGINCDIEVLAAEAFIPLEVTPEVDIANVDLVASCSATPGSTDLEVSFDVENIGGPYAENVTFELYFDIDGSGELEVDDPLLETVVQPATLASNTTETFMVTFTVPQDQACPVLVRALVPNCTCGEVVVPFDPVTPDFISDIGTNFAICPGDSLVLEDLCLSFTLALEPAEAGNAVQRNDSIVVTLNPGFGVLEPVVLTATNDFGSCGTQEFEVLLTQLETFEFGPYEFDVCEEGCQILDLNIPVELQEDLVISFTDGADFISDPTSFEPEICDPTGNRVYTIEFELNGQCVATTTLTTTTFGQPSVSLNAATGCSTGFTVSDIVTVTPVGLNGTILATNGDGTFSPSTAPASTNPDFQVPQALLSDNATYTPGPEDLANGEVQITVTTDNPDGPCGGAVARETFTILLVDCGSFFWDGERD